jgi:hypothetical protein
VSVAVRNREISRTVAASAVCTYSLSHCHGGRTSVRSFAPTGGRSACVAEV